MEQTGKLPAWQTNLVTSADGTTVGYRQTGSGPGLILIHGGLQSSRNFTKLGTYLADNFTVYVPDRRGRGMSGTFGDNYSLVKDCEDIKAILDETNAQYIFGLSSGAIISLHTTLLFPGQVEKTAIYEPPFTIEIIPRNVSFIQRYEREITKGKLAAAFVTVIKALNMSPMFQLLPRFILVPLFKLALNREDDRPGNSRVTLKSLIPTFHYDHVIVTETTGTIENYKSVKADVLLLGGSKSPGYLLNVLQKLQTILPRVKSVVFDGLDHLGSDNSGKPEVVAAELKLFFGE
jgi:pimeloyl-ACP methyl ester carboxylesterase